ncbi:MAG: arsenite methyltransferase [Actinobacteria bacterium]|nr:arsenite methyltransferase [Actinomycetota bacterium]
MSETETFPSPNVDREGGDPKETRRRQQRTHAAVSEAYTRAVDAGSGCCGDAEPKGVAAKLAGYSPEEMAALPKDALANSFGCGNPLAFSDVEPGEVVLDLGSGAGIDLLLAAAKVGPTGRVIGVDMTDVMIERARANAAAAGFDTIEVRMGIIEELPVETASVDLVISNCVINLSPDKERVFREIARVLKPGGRLRVSDIVVRELPRWARESAQLYSSCIAGAISEDQYLAGIEAAGLENVQVAERLVYDTVQLEALIGSEIVEGAEGSPGCCGAVAESVDLAEGAAELQGEVWSAIFLARKPS